MMQRLLRMVCAGMLISLLWVNAVWAAESDAWRAVFATSEQLAAINEPFVCILTIQHPDSIRTLLADKPSAQFAGENVRRQVRQITGLRCEIVHFVEVSGADLDRDQIKAILITGRSKLVSQEADARFYPLIRSTRIPIFGFCGGMQLIGGAYDVPIAPLRKLGEGEADPNPGYHPGQFKEWGFLPVQIVRRDPLFESLPDEIVVREAHAFQVPRVPDEFLLLASTAECQVEAFKHRDRMVYGTQFHPEVNNSEHPHGRVILENFFRLIGLAQTPADTK